MKMKHHFKKWVVFVSLLSTSQWYNTFVKKLSQRLQEDIDYARLSTY